MKSSLRYARHIPAVLRELRAQAGLSQLQMSVRAEVHVNTYRGWERSRSTPYMDGLTKVADVLNTMPSEILRRCEEIECRMAAQKK